MRIARFSIEGQSPTFGIVELVVDGGDNPDTIAAITGDPLAGMKVNWTGQRYPLDEVRLLAPVIPRSKIIGVARNYPDRTVETSGKPPSQLPLFFKPNTTVIGPGDPIVFPEGIEELGYEGELAVVIGRIAKQVPAERVPEVIFGYTIANDVTVRGLTSDEGQWAKAKGWDTFCPVGPWINTHSPIAEASNWKIETHLNSELCQVGNTAEMLTSITELVVYISEFTTLLPGDLILTGTPAGAGLMSPGDVVSVDIEGIGTLSNPVVSAASSDNAVD